MKVVFLDLETAGLKVEDEIAQIAAIATSFERGRFYKDESFNVKLKIDETKASKEALEVIKYSPESWKDAVTSYTAFSKFQEFLSRHADIVKISKRGKPYKVCAVAGYNTEYFDMPRIWHHAQNLQIFLPMQMWSFDVLQYVRWKKLFNPKFVSDNDKLETIARTLEIRFPENASFHDALTDVHVTIEVMNKIFNERI